MSTNSPSPGPSTTPWRSPQAARPDRFLGSGLVIQTQHPQVRRLAASLRGGRDDEQFARAAFEWVRDEIAHSFDAGDPRATLTASEVLYHGVGLCYAKSHLAAAVLRAGGVPTGLCYQLLADEENGFVLHGLIAVYLRGRWHRQDVRGNRPGLDAQFSLDRERLAYTLDPESGEIDYPHVQVAPARTVVDVLSTAENILTATLPSSLGRGSST
ncbi:transglutaminase-like domain-containing protein [Cellulosimicrobium cellulans]|uniref:transglutaminase-like domain-containing protein n=1 Tax=Cellulosimicrobium cellulans TaxID=1710 RepID=UPI00130E0B35|nr:transglutaminase family protein [Cellulosimicrobium cellulans]